VPLYNLDVCAKFRPFAMEMHQTAHFFGLPRNVPLGQCPCLRYFYTGVVLSTVLVCMSRGQFGRCTVFTLRLVHVLCRNGLRGIESFAFHMKCQGALSLYYSTVTLEASSHFPFIRHATVQRLYTAVHSRGIHLIANILYDMR